MIVDLTGIALSCIAGFFGILSIALPSIIDRHARRHEAREVVRHSIRNSVGALQQSGTAGGQMLMAGGAIPEVPLRLEPAVRYVIDDAGPELDLLDITPAQVARKILARIGLAEIATNQAVAGGAGPLVPPPLGPLATVSTLTLPPDRPTGAR